jgi:hypothetical protein
MYAWNEYWKQKHAYNIVFILCNIKLRRNLLHTAWCHVNITGVVVSPLRVKCTCSVNRMQQWNWVQYTGAKFNMTAGCSVSRWSICCVWRGKLAAFCTVRRTFVCSGGDNFSAVTKCTVLWRLSCVLLLTAISLTGCSGGKRKVIHWPVLENVGEYLKNARRT